MTPDAFVIMPDHLHGIMVMTEDAGTAAGVPKAAPPSPALDTVVGTFKAACTRAARRLRLLGREPLWQRGYYERIVRNERAMNMIRRYIAENPTRWFDRA